MNFLDILIKLFHIQIFGLYMNSDKTEFMCFNQDSVISLLDGKPLKLVDEFTYLGSNISSTESDVNIVIGKAWTAIDRLMIIWKSDISDKIKGKLFQVVLCQEYYMVKILGEKARWEQHKDAACCFKQILEAATNKIAAIWSLTSHLANYSRKMSKTSWKLL